MSLRSVAAAAALAAALAACGEAPPPATPVTPPAPVPSAAPTAGPAQGLGGVDATILDRSVSPCDDFYQYACGGWFAANPIPAHESSWTRSFDTIQQANENLLREILERYARGEGKDDPYAQKLGDFYAACMDEDAIEKAGTAALAPELGRIDAIKTPKDLAAEIGHLHAQGVHAAFDLDPGQDAKDATRMIGIVSQGGLAFPDRDYYLADDAKMRELRAAYHTHLTALFTLAGEKPKDAEAHAALALAVETALARASMDKVDVRDPQKTYHRVDRAALQKAAPAFPFDAYFAALGTPDMDALNLAMPSFVEGLGKAIERSSSTTCASSDKPCPPPPARFPVAEWRAYLRARVLRAAARWLPKRFEDERFRFERALTGAERLPPRWQRCVRAVDHAMPEALGRPFVERTLGAEGRDAVRHMVAAIEAAQRDNLAHLAWMDADTRARAAEKLALIANKIGYPDHFRSYDGLAVARGDAWGNNLHAEAFEKKRQLARIGRPVDRTEWDVSPPTVDAYYNPNMTEMVFPAGILRPPMFGLDASTARNHGALGWVIGHELTHGYDDEGRQYDGHGNLRDWWTSGVAAEFVRRASCVAEQFDGYVAVDDVHENGKLELGENIADLGGVKLALAAFHKELQDHPERRAGGAFSDEQQFFLGYAQAGCTNIRNEEARLRATIDPHALPHFRVNGPVSNMPELAAAFSCAAGSPMVRAKRCEVW